MYVHIIICIGSYVEIFTEYTQREILIKNTYAHNLKPGFLMPNHIFPVTLCTIIRRHWPSQILK